MKDLKLINDYMYEYHRTTGNRRELTYNAGWYTFPSGEKGRRADVIKATEVLKARPRVFSRMEPVNGVMTKIEASQHVVKSFMPPHKDVIEERNTSYGCSVADESYWSN
jgi:hypothetical protein